LTLCIFYLTMCMYIFTLRKVYHIKNGCYDLSGKKECKMSKFFIQNNIRKLRFHADEMTQQDLADKVGVSRQTIVAIEKGKYSPSLKLAFKIAKVFDSSLEQVFSYEPNNQEKRHGKVSGTR
jgi:putative transcriptional regulator